MVLPEPGAPQCRVARQRRRLARGVQRQRLVDDAQRLPQVRHKPQRRVPAGRKGHAPPLLDLAHKRLDRVPLLPGEVRLGPGVEAVGDEVLDVAPADGVGVRAVEPAAHKLLDADDAREREEAGFHLGDGLGVEAVVEALVGLGVAVSVEEEEERERKREGKGFFF